MSEKNVMLMKHQHDYSICGVNKARTEQGVIRAHEAMP